MSRLSRPANDKRTSCRQKGHIPIEIFKTVSCCFQVTRKMNGRSVGKPALVEICEEMANVLQSGFNKSIFLLTFKNLLWSFMKDPFCSGPTKIVRRKNEFLG